MPRAPVSGVRGRRAARPLGSHRQRPPHGDHGAPGAVVDLHVVDEAGDDGQRDVGVDERVEGAPASATASTTGLSDDQMANTPKNAPCPCGSGKKFKMCHGRR